MQKNTQGHTLTVETSAGISDYKFGALGTVGVIPVGTPLPPLQCEMRISVVLFKRFIMNRSPPEAG